MDRYFTMPERLWADRAVMALLIGATAWLSLTLVRGPGELAAVWIGNGILTGWLLSRPTASWPGYVMAGFMADVIARMLAAYSAPYAVAIGISDMTEVLIVSGAVRRLVPNVGDPKRWIGLGGIATVSTLIACAVSGLLAATATVLLGRSFWGVFFGWYAAHVVGMVIVATSTLVIHREGFGILTAPGRRWSLVGTMFLVMLVGIAVFYFDYPVLFLTYPPLLLGAFKHGFVGVAVGVILLATIGSIATALGYGPFWLVEGMSANGRISLLQLYIAGGCLMTIPVALAMAERKRLTARLRDSERRYRMLADYSHDVVVRMRADGERLYVSPSAENMLGWKPAEMLGSRWDLVHPEDRERQAQSTAKVIASGAPQTEIYRIRHKDGRDVWVEAVAQPIPSADRQDETDVIFTARDISRRIVTEQALEASRLELERMARVDALTGLANRRQFEERL